MPIREVVLTKEELSDELAVLYPELTPRDRAQACAQDLGTITARTIVGYIMGERPPATKFCSDFLVMLNERHPERAYKLSQSTILQSTNEVVQEHKRDLLMYERSIDKMCASCAGKTVEEGGTCWDSVECPLAAFTKYPPRNGGSK